MTGRGGTAVVVVGLVVVVVVGRVVLVVVLVLVDVDVLVEVVACATRKAWSLAAREQDVSSEITKPRVRRRPAIRSTVPSQSTPPAPNRLHRQRPRH